MARSFGGAQRLCVETVQALKEAGHDVDLLVTEETDLQPFRQRYGFDLGVNKEFVILRSVPKPTIYSNLVIWLLRDIIAVPFLKTKYDLTMNTGPLLPIGFDDLMYIHDSPCILRAQRARGKYRSGTWRAYSLYHDALESLIVWGLTHLNMIPLLLVNSRFNGQAVENDLHKKSLVLYPPVYSEDYSGLSKLKDRDDIVLTISRIEEPKGLDLILNVAAKVHNAKFVIIGSSGSKRYLKNLYQTISELGLEKRVIIIPNADEKVKKAYLAKAKIYLHANQYEAFGISVVEAMASGLVPIVYKNGAPWTDILCEEQGLYGYGYSDVCSCANLIEALLQNDYLRNETAKRSLNQALRFDRKIYRKAVVKLIGKCLGFKDVK